MSENAAIDEGLNIGSSKQAINDNKAKTDYKSAYLKLQNDLEKAESEMVREEIEKEMETILPNLKGKTFADPNDKKAQVNIKKRIDKAYEKLLNANMKSLAKQFQQNIKNDDSYEIITIINFLQTEMLLQQEWHLYLPLISPDLILQRFHSMVSIWLHSSAIHQDKNQ